MKRNRYVEWTTVWETFASIKRKEGASDEEWRSLYNLLNRLWQEEREKDATPEELAAHAGALLSMDQ